MSFSKTRWAPVSPPHISPKRPRSDSVVSFDLPSPKRPKSAWHKGYTPESPSLPEVVEIPNRSADSMQVVAGREPSSYVCTRASTVAPSESDTVVSSVFSTDSLNSSETSRFGESYALAALTLPTPTGSEVEIGARDQLDGQCESRVTTATALTAFSPWHFPIAAARLFSEERIRKAILGFLTCHGDHTFRPCFRQGMLRGFLAQPKVRWNARFPAEDDDNVYRKREIMANNVSFPELLVSKTFAEEYCISFYSQHHFEFDHPRAARWFFENIGIQNFSALKHVRFEIYGGFDSTIDDRNDLNGQSYEELWFETFCWLKRRHNLKKLTIVVKQLLSGKVLAYKVNKKELWSEEVEEREMYLSRLREAIMNLRGLKKANLIDSTRQVFPDQHDMLNCQLFMQQRRPTYSPANDMRQLPLSATLAKVKNARRQQEDWSSEFNNDDDVGTVYQASTSQSGLTRNQRRNQRKRQRQQKRQRQPTKQAEKMRSAGATATVGPQISMRPASQNGMHSPRDMPLSVKNMGEPQKSQTYMDKRTSSQHTHGRAPHKTLQETASPAPTTERQRQLRGQSGSFIGQKRPQQVYGRRRYDHNRPNAELDPEMTSHWSRHR